MGHCGGFCEIKRYRHLDRSIQIALSVLSYNFHIPNRSFNFTTDYTMDSNKKSECDPNLTGSCATKCQYLGNPYPNEKGQPALHVIKGFNVQRSAGNGTLTALCSRRSLIFNKAQTNITALANTPTFSRLSLND
jgi:hypothetical protein